MHLAAASVSPEFLSTALCPCLRAQDTEIAAHLSACYGDNYMRVLHLANEHQLGKRLVPVHPVLEAEVMYTAQVRAVQEAEVMVQAFGCLSACHRLAAHSSSGWSCGCAAVL